MAERPRQHTLEEESRNELRRILPRVWVFRDTRPDYGIDGEVEIFDSDGNSTQVNFYVQIKATEAWSGNKSRSIRLPNKKVVQYRRAKRPVLLAVYDARKKEFFVRWFHEFLINYSEQQKTFTFTFNGRHIWTSSSADRLYSDVLLYDEMHSPSTPSPIHVAVECLDTSIRGTHRASLTAALRESLRHQSGFKYLPEPESAPCHVLLEFRKDSVRTYVSKQPLATITLHERDHSPDELVAEALVSMGIALEIVGHHVVSARLFAEAKEKSRAIFHPLLVPIVARCLLCVEDFGTALYLCDQLQTIESSEAQLWSHMLRSAVVQKSSSPTAELQGQLQTLFRNSIELAEGEGDRKALAFAYYNYGNNVSSLKASEQVRYYKMAARLEPQYLERSYFCKEIASLCFHLGLYRLAAVWYGKAQSLEDDPEVTCLLADALMWSGKYGRACEEFERVVSVEGHLTSEWFLKFRSLTSIRLFLQCDSQNRRPESALEIAGRDSETDKADAQCYYDALRIDALCSLAWYNLGNYNNKNGEKSEAFICYSNAALFFVHDLEAWCNAIAIAFSCQLVPLELLASVFDVAHFYNGDKLLYELESRIRTKNTDRKDKVLDGFNTMMEHLERPQSTTVLRVHGENGEYHSVDMSKW